MKSKPTIFGFISTIIPTIIVLGIDIGLLMFKAANVPGGQVSHTISQVVVAIIIALFLTGIFQLVFKTDSLAGFSGTISSHLTAIGILGTFTGIFIGLYYFNVNDLKNSVPLLLEGMKVAFSTSIAGLVSSIGLKFTHSVVVSISMEDDPFIKNDGYNTGVHSILYDSRDILKKIRAEIGQLNSGVLIDNDKVLSAPELEKNIVILIMAISELSGKLSDFITKQEEKLSSTK